MKVIGARSILMNRKELRERSLAADAPFAEPSPWIPKDSCRTAPIESKLSDLSPRIGFWLAPLERPG